MSTHVHAINQQPHQVQRVERRRPPRIQLRLSLRDKASTDRTLARAPRGDVGAERFQTPRILAGRHTDQHLVDHAPVQRVRIREYPGRWQRNLLAGAPRTGPTNRHLPPAQHDLTRRMPRSIRLARRLMRIPWPTDGGPILFQHGFEYLQARRDDQLLELGLRINEDIDQRQVPWRRGYRLATARDCARLLLQGGSLLGDLHLGFVTGRIARPVKSRRFKFQQLLGHPPCMVLVTATTRLSRELRQDYDRKQEAAGLSSWPAAQILPFSAWLSELWTGWLYSGPTRPIPRLLRPAEEWVVWEDIVRSGAKNLLLEVPATAEAALDAWNLLCAWALPLDAPEWRDSADSETFHLWAKVFSRRCRERGWLSGAELPAFVANLVGEGAIPIPKEVEVAGFLELTPVQQRVFDSLTNRGVKILGRTFPDSTSEGVRLGLVDRTREIRAAAEWARSMLESASDAAASKFRIGVIVPDLGRCRSQIERVFAEAFHPRSRLRPDLDPRQLFNISLGLPVNEYPIIDAAFLFVGTDPEAMPIEIVGRLLRSPFVHGAEEELSSRALLDAALRALREPAVSLADIIKMGSRGDVLYRCPMLSSRLRAWSDARQSLRASQMPSDWAPALSQVLQAIGWPGDRGLNSSDYQTLEVWNTLLSELAGLDSVTGRVPMDTAVGMLRRLASSRQFQPESGPAPVQILGVFESSGLRFDRLWIMGMHDNAWPAAPAPDPFLPFRLQRRFNMPRCSPDRELEFTQVLTTRLLASAPIVVVSYPQREDDSDLRVSPLFRALPEVAVDDLGLLASARYVEQLHGSSRMETLEDHHGPPCDDAALNGGMSLFKLQAACPFKAFAELRLGAKALDQPEPGLSALDRGQLIHRILERVWQELESYEGLLSTPEDRVKAIVRTTVGQEVQGLSQRRRALRRPRFAAIEQVRLERVIGDWLLLEMKRRPFTVLEQEENRHVTVGNIDLRIRADRVDCLEDGGLIILDYKTGECSPSDWDGPRPDEPQLPIYAVTADSLVVGVFFGRLKTGHVGFRGLAHSEGIVPDVTVSDTQAPLGDTIRDWRDVLDRLGNDFRAGRAAVDPKDRHLTCRYCALPTLCRISQADDRQSGRDDA